MGWDEQFALRYDEWSARMTEDVPFYVGLAVDIDGPLVELAIGSGRVAIPVALATGRTVIGIDSSRAMFAQARAAAAGAGVALDLREGDIVILSSMSQRASSTVPSGRSFTSRRGRPKACVDIADDRIDFGLDDGGTSSLWWATKNECSAYSTWPAWNSRRSTASLIAAR